MPKVTCAGENHRHVAIVGGGDDFFIPDRAAGLNRARGASIGRGEKTVWEWEKSVARDRAALEGQTGLGGFPNRNA